VAAPAATLVEPEIGYAMFAGAGLTGLGVCLADRILGYVRRERIHDMLVAGEVPSLASVVAEARRLGDPRHREQLAAALERALDEGRRWYEFMPASRPPSGVRHLPQHAGAIEDISTALRHDSASVRGVVMVERLMRGGYGSAIYGSEADWLRRELGRIRFELTGRS